MSAYVVAPLLPGIFRISALTIEVTNARISTSTCSFVFDINPIVVKFLL